MITYFRSKTTQELSAIIALQKKNLTQNLAPTEIKSQGFVTVSHSLTDLEQMNNYEQHLIIKDDDIVIGYILAMTQHSKNDIPLLIPMFNVFDNINYKDKPVSSYNYIVVGQVCIDKDHRGKGPFDKGYDAYKQFFKDHYDFAITEIATTNERSIHAHKRVGFSEIHRYTDHTNIEWSIVLWHWNK